MNFEPTTYPLGDIKLGQQAEGVFYRLSPKPIKSVEPGCGCTTYQLTQNELRVTMSAGVDFPEAIKEAGLSSYETAKVINIYYEDDTIDQLFVSARISR